jgi:pilus assembly protein FimV
MLRKLALSLAVSAALGVSQAYALGLGEIKVNSALNEPLDAEIKLTQVRDLSPLQIQPRMAAVDEYSLAGGVNQTRYLRDIQFQVQLTPDGAGTIRLRSREPIQEPFLNFMVEVNWPSGRLVREYTLLLDPPVFDPTPVRRTVQPAQLAQLEPPAAVQPVEPRQQPATVNRAVAASNIRSRMDADTQVYVGVNDTLWEIAARKKPAGISEQQMMLALLRKNPAAFPSGNINTLRAGSVLDLPTREEAARLTHREAVAEVARQTQLWREGRLQRQQPQPKAPVDVSRQAGESTGAVAGAGAETATAGVGTTATTESGAAVQEGQLKIVAPVDEQPDRQAAETVAGDEIGVERDRSDAVSSARERLENEVLIAQEKIDRLERENTELNDKLNSVLEQLEAQSRLLELQSQQMATLQTELARDAARSTATESAQKDSASLLQNPAVLGGLGAGALAVLAALWLMLRRRGADKPDKKRELVNVPEDLRERNESENKDSGAGTAAAAAAAAAGAGAAAAAMAADDSDTERPAPLAPLSGEGEEETAAPTQKPAPDEPQDLDRDLQSLDLDMDLDLNDLDIDDEPESDQLDGSLDELEDEADARVDAAEFDLAAKDGVTEEPDVQAAEEAAAESEEIPTAETAERDELEFNVKPAEVDEEPSELDSMLSDSDDSDDLDFLLSGNGEQEQTSASQASDDERLEDALKEENGFSLADDAVMPTDDMNLDDEQLFDKLETDKPALDNSLHETVAAVEDDDYEIDHDLEAMLQGAAGDADDEAAEVEITDSADDDLDSLLASFDPEDDPSAGAAPARSGEQVEEALAANISHDLEMDLDSEVDELLSSTDDEIALDEQRRDEAVEVLDKMNLLNGTDEIETKLDLARAYMEMDDKDGAREILNEITREGSKEQRLEAQKLLDSLS